MAGSGRIKGITIEIGGDTTKLVSALKKVDSQIKNTQSTLKDVNKLLKMDPGNTELLQQKQKALNDAIGETKARLVKLRAAQSQVKEGTAEWDALQREIIATEQDLKSLEKELKDFGSVGLQKLKAVSDKFKEMGENIKSAGEKISGVGQTLTTKVTAPIVAAFGSAVKVTADFDAQMSKVQAISGATGEQFNTLRDKAREMGANTKFSATEAGEAFEYMGMAGWKTEQMLEGIPAILNLAAASGEELGTTSDIVTDALTAFGYKAEDAGRFADILAAASVNANTNVSMLGESFKYAAAPAGALGYSAEDVAVALGLMANSGIKADMAGTSLRNMFQRMAKPTKESAMAMERLGLELYDNTGKMYSFREVMDQMRRGFTEINIPLEEYNAQIEALDNDLAEGTITQKKYDSALEELNLQAFGAEGAEKARAAAMLGGARAMSGLLAIANATEEDYNKLTEAIDNSSNSFARLADGSVIPLNEALASGAEIMETYEGQAAAMAATMQDNLTGDITVLKSMIQELAISMGDLLMPIIRKVVEKIQSVVDYLNSLDESQKEQILKIAAIVAAIGPVLLIIGQVVTAIGGLITFIGMIANPVGLVITAIMALVAAFTYFYNTNEEFRNTVTNVINAIMPVLQAIFDFIKTQFLQMVDNIRSHIETIKAIVRAFPVAMEYVKQKIASECARVKEIFHNLKDVIISIFKNGLIPTFKTFGRDMIDNFISGIKEKFNAVKETFTNLGELIKSYIHFSEPDVGPLSNFHTYAPDMMKLFAQGITQNAGLITDAIKQSFNVQPIIEAQQVMSKNQTMAAPMAQNNAPIAVNVTLQGDAKYLYKVVNAEAIRNHQITGISFGT